MTYAKETQVPVDRSRTEIEKILTRHGATTFGFLTQGDSQLIVFEIDQRRVLIRLPMPDRDARVFHRTSTGRARTALAAGQAYDQEVRSRWRALALIIKAKLVAVSAGVTTIEQEFLYHIVLPDGQTFGEWAAPQLDQIYTSGEMPALMPGRTGR